MDKKKIISHPTPKTSPDLLVYGKDNLADILNHDNIFDKPVIIPRSFKDATNSFPVIEKYHDKKYPKKFFWRQALREVCKEEYVKGYFRPDQGKEESFLIDLSIVFTVFTTLSALFIYLRFFCDDPSSGQSQFNSIIISFLVAFACVFASVWFVGFSPWGVDCDEESMKKNLCYKVPKEDKERVCMSQFIYMKEYPNKYLHQKRNVLSTMEKFVYELFMDNELDIIQSIQTTHIPQLYDDVMDMLVFTLANYDSISPELREDYIEELHKKIEELQKMTEDFKKETEDIKQHKKNIYQKSLDDEAMMFMPVKRKEK